nr:hypothetical protein [Nitrospirales bacterium]
MSHPEIEQLKIRCRPCDFHEQATNQPHATERVTTGDEQELCRLAALPLLDYGRCRKEPAKTFGVGVGILDAEVARRRSVESPATGQGQIIQFDDITPALEPVDGPELLDEIVRFLSEYIILPPHGADAIALWAVYAHCFDQFDIAPRLALQSPEKRCGKTTVYELLIDLVPRALCTSNVTPAAIFRVIETAHPTLLIDEMDSFAESREELRGILNSGHTRGGAVVIRTVGEEHEPRAFSTWSPMALACIGRLPDTVEDRSIIIRMQRKAPTDKVTTLRRCGRSAAER